jgi:type II secretory pathway pseudopilin PulG
LPSLPRGEGRGEGELHGRAAGFTLIEILVTTALLAFIVIGLVAMFGQTQRAFTQSLTDVDLLENGRAVMDLLVRDLAEAAPANISNAVNFYVELPQPGEAIYTPPLLQGLPGTVNPPQERVNYLQPFYFLSHPNQMWPDRAWAETGYYVVPDARGVGIGTLYRYAATNYVPPPLPLPTGFPANPPNPSFWGSAFLSALGTLRTDTTPLPAGAPVSTVTRVAEGVVHLSVRPFATNGFPIVSDLNPLLYGYTTFWVGYWTSSNGFAIYVETPLPILQATNHLNLACPDQYDRCWFLSNAVPACVELELGILESQTYHRYQAIAVDNPAAGAAFLSNHVAQVHLFRQRVPIHNVDPSAY